jgi:hypothetical protein
VLRDPAWVESEEIRDRLAGNSDAMVSMRINPVIRPAVSRVAISAAIHPPIDEPITSTSLRSRSSRSCNRSAARSGMLRMSSGRSVPFQPGSVGVIVCIVLARCPTIAGIVIGPPPP